MESIIQYLQSLSPAWVYAALFAIAYIENIFPPSPSDVIIVAGGSLIGIGHINFIPALLFATLGSTTGFMTMYIIGDWFGLSIIEKNKIKFIPLENIHKVEAWFRKYGYLIIIANRFLSGTRAVVGFFAGMSELKLLQTTALCFFSALLWNAILIYIGTLLGQNWEAIGSLLSTYSKIVTVLLVLVVIISLIVWYYRRSNKNKNEIK